MPVEAKIEIRAAPGAKKNEVVGEIEGAIRIKIAAPPVEGKANKALIEFMAKKLGLKKSAVSIVSGETGRRKIIAVKGMDVETVKKTLLEE